MKRIKSINIQNSTFFEDSIRINFSSKLNCIMGGRGTGKSTILHMILSTINSNAEFDKTTFSILKNNLGDGKITIDIEDQYGKNYEIVKTFNEDPQTYLLPTKTFCPIENIENDIECDIYKAAAIEEIGMNGRSRLALIDKMLGEEVKLLEGKIREKQTELDDNAHFLKNENSKVKQLEERIKDYESAESDFENHKKEQPEDIITKEKEQFEAADKDEKLRFAEKRFVEDIYGEIKDFIESAEEQIMKINNLINVGNIEFSNKNNELMNSFIEDIKNQGEKIIKIIQDSRVIAEDISKKTEQFIEKLTKVHQEQQNDFIKLKQKFEKHKLYYSQYNKLSKRVDEKKVLQKELKTIKDNQSKLQKTRVKLINELNENKKLLFDKRSEKIQSLNEKFDGVIKIILIYGGITNKYEEVLQKAFRGSNMRYNVIIPNIVMNFTPDKFAQIIHTKDSNSLKNILGINKERLDAIFSLLYESEALYEIEKIYCPDLPEFLLKIDRRDKGDIKREDFKRTEELSTGQRCTTILPIIFAISKNPLLIDQPEDNLDNKYITETIHKIIREEKQSRQLIFITHNPNIPVLSDSEHNIFLIYSNKKAKVEKEGNVESVKGHILNLLEGGKEAFNTRRKIYGI